MTTYKRICIEDFTREDSIGQKLELKRGTEYITSEEENGNVAVFTTFWESVPVALFAGEKRFT